MTFPKVGVPTLHAMITLCPCPYLVADMPAALPAWPDSDDLANQLRASCPNAGTSVGALANATLCCSGQRSELLAAALGNGFMGCTGLCVYSPTGLDWIWDPDNQCWVHDNPSERACPRDNAAAQAAADMAFAEQSQATILEFFAGEGSQALPADLAEQIQVRMSQFKDASIWEDVPAKQGRGQHSHQIPSLWVEVFV